MLIRLLLSLGIALLMPALAMAQTPEAADPGSAAGATGATVDPSLAAPAPVAVELPVPVDHKVIDIPNDGGDGVGVVWNWDREIPEDSPAMVSIQAQLTADMLEKFKLSEHDRNVVDNARARLREELAPLLPERDAADAALAAAKEALTEAEIQASIDGPGPELDAALKERWAAQDALDAVTRRVQAAKDRYESATGKLEERARIYEALEASYGRDIWAPTDVTGTEAGAFGTKGTEAGIFGRNPEGADMLLAIVNQIVLPNPATLAAAELPPHDDLDRNPTDPVSIPVDATQTYVLRMVVEAEEVVRHHDLGGVQPGPALVTTTLLNGLVMAVLFAILILAAVLLARKNPNLFIRRIAGLEAVDEAIGRATEMGKPVLYVNGMNDLTDLSTLAAINILGRVARRIADFDSDLLVPTRDPVVMTVAQEVVREGYSEAGRPDAYRQDNIFFVTEDQFSFTASTCGIMLREKPAANFFMGYYYAESLLLAETGAATGAIQIAGTDSQSQLPFFITTCDYTLIGEELYAASAYLSREPMLLGSLKGLDLTKAIVMVVIILQTLLFLINPEWNFIRNIFETL
jgi:hypothetical protein